MVTPELKRHFESQGIQLISLEAGATALLRELQSNNNSAVEVVLGEAFEGELPEANTPPRHLFKKTISLDTHPVLEAHKLQGKPVVPLALLMDWLGQATTKAYPDQALLGYNNVRVLNGVILNQKSYNVWLEQSDVQEHNGQTHLSLTLFGEASRGLAKPHLRATAVLGPKDAIGSAHKWDINESLRPYPIPIEQGYQEILFHGSALHGLTEVVGYSEHWIQALSQTAPPPSDWEAQPGLAQWAHDPLVIDDAFQLAILWCFATQDHVSLPTSFESYRQYKSTFSGPIQISLRVNQVTSHQAKGDFQFCDTQGEVVAEIFGYTCTMDASLMQAFHP